jgi:hypothetical protein
VQQFSIRGELLIVFEPGGIEAVLEALWAAEASPREAR